MAWALDSQSARGHIVRIMEGQADRVLEGHVSVLWGHAGWSSEKVVKMPGGQIAWWLEDIGLPLKGM